MFLRRKQLWRRANSDPISNRVRYTIRIPHSQQIEKQLERALSDSCIDTSNAALDSRLEQMSSKSESDIATPKRVSFNNSTSCTYQLDQNSKIMD
jgi:hypothetical protein